MAKPTALTELNGAKLLPLIDSTATTSAVRALASLVSANQTGGGDTTVPPGWMAIGTHRDTDTLLTPGGWTIPSPSPLIIIGGADSASATEGSRVARPVRVHEGGALYMLPGSSLSTANGYQIPLIATGGEVTMTAAGGPTAFTSTLASNFGYLTDIQLQLYVTSGNASTVTLDDGATAFWKASFAASALGTTITEQLINFHFSVPQRSNAAAGAFRYTTTGATTQWTIRANGFFATA